MHLLFLRESDFSYHSFMQSKWKMCLHFNWIILSPLRYSEIQMLQVFSLQKDVPSKWSIFIYPCFNRQNMFMFGLLPDRYSEKDISYLPRQSTLYMYDMNIKENDTENIIDSPRKTSLNISYSMWGVLSIIDRVIGDGYFVGCLKAMVNCILSAYNWKSRVLLCFTKSYILYEYSLVQRVPWKSILVFFMYNNGKYGSFIEQNLIFGLNFIIDNWSLLRFTLNWQISYSNISLFG